MLSFHVVVECAHQLPANLTQENSVVRALVETSAADETHHEGEKEESGTGEARLLPSDVQKFGILVSVALKSLPLAAVGPRDSGFEDVLSRVWQLLTEFLVVRGTWELHGVRLVLETVLRKLSLKTGQNLCFEIIQVSH